MPARVRKRGKRGVWREGEGALAHYLRCFKRKRIGRETSLSLSLSLSRSPVACVRSWCGCCPCVQGFHCIYLIYLHSRRLSLLHGHHILLPLAVLIFLFVAIVMVVIMIVICLTWIPCEDLHNRHKHIITIVLIIMTCFSSESS